TRLIHDFCCTSAILFNIVLVIIIFKKTPDKLRSYSIVLLNMETLQSATAVTSLFIFTRLSSTEPSLWGGGRGLWIQSGSPRLCFVAVPLMLFGHNQNIIMLGFTFCYRY
ncbi:hypothetical protein PENTCL1PPCAC_14193, partial [Pristionchus entomophagus]